MLTSAKGDKMDDLERNCMSIRVVLKMFIKREAQGFNNLFFEYYRM